MVEVAGRFCSTEKPATQPPRPPAGGVKWPVTATDGSPVLLVLRNDAFFQHFRPWSTIRQIPTGLMDQPRNALHLLVINPLRAIVHGVVIRMQPGVKEQGRNAPLQKGPLIAAPQQV